MERDENPVNSFHPMSPENLFHELLGLGANCQVTELAYLKGGRGEVRIVIEQTDALFESLNKKTEGNLEEKREFFKKIGSNFQLSGAKLLFSYRLPYFLLSKK